MLARSTVRVVNYVIWIALLVSIYFFLNLVGVSVQDLIDQMYAILSTMTSFSGI